MSDKAFTVYMMASKPYGTVYTGMTSNMMGRDWQHKNKIYEGFTKKYGVTMLVYYEQHPSFESALKREKQIKAWQRQWKINLINQNNPHWEDLSVHFTL